jgi:transcriptional regulator with XRE-family HTH domain
MPGKGIARGRRQRRLFTVNDSLGRRSAFGRLLRHWRGLRGLSQLALAQETGTTTRHLSYIENGRSRPGRDLVLRLAEALDVPLRSRNELLAAAGLSVEFRENELGSTALEPYRRAVLGVMEAVNPFPAFALDACFNLHEANRAARSLLAGVRGPVDGSASDGRPLNLVDVFLAPGPSREQIANFPEVAWSWHARLSRAMAGLERESEAWRSLKERIEAYLRDVPRPLFEGAGDPVTCPTFRIGDRLVRTIGMTMRFGPSRDVTLEELSVDLLCPRDAEADAFFRSLVVS